ncbi:MAG: hypothetical protein ACE5F1_19340 [Planctomycetota bacterium]
MDYRQATEIWTYPTNPNNWHISPLIHRHDGCSFLLPNFFFSTIFENTVYRVGGLVTERNSNVLTLCDEQR